MFEPSEIRDLTISAVRRLANTKDLGPVKLSIPEEWQSGDSEGKKALLRMLARILSHLPEEAWADLAELAAVGDSRGGGLEPGVQESLMLHPLTKLRGRSARAQLCVLPAPRGPPARAGKLALEANIVICFDFEGGHRVWLHRTCLRCPCLH